MTNNNDKRILELKKQIEEKKEKLGKVTRFTPVTNCSLEVFGARCNINTLDKEKLTELLLFLGSQIMQAKAIGLDLDSTLRSGYTLTDWYEDVGSKLTILSKQDEAKNLKLMEDKLVKMLSTDKKTQLEIDEIESMLKGEA